MKTSIIRPLITEKTMGTVGSGWYTFRVDVFADKHVVKNEIESLYGVSVTGVRSCVMHGKMQRVGKKGKTIAKSDWKKVFVKLKSGQTIDAFQIGGSSEEIK
jgi:large subunit ribosomal protein L23